MRSVNCVTKIALGGIEVGRLGDWVLVRDRDMKGWANYRLLLDCSPRGLRKRVYRLGYHIEERRWARGRDWVRLNRDWPATSLWAAELAERDALGG